MSFFELANNRRSVHHFVPNVDFSDDDFKQILKTVQLTPSGYNAQPWEFILIREPETKKQIHELAFKQEHVLHASALVVVLGDKKIVRDPESLAKDWVEHGHVSADEADKLLASFTKKHSDDRFKDMALRNSAIAATTFLYAAKDLGWDTCPMMGFAQLKLRHLLGVPEDRLITMMIAIGKSDDSKLKPRLPRKSIEQISHYEYWESKEP